MHRGRYAFGWDSKLRKTDDFSSVFRFKRVRRGAGMDVFYCPNGLLYPRLGLIMPKKVWARAVDRNRVRRILREAFRLDQGELGGLDVVIRVKATAQDVDYRAQWRDFVRRHTAASPPASAPPMNG
ncbi:MAG: ribonuclease P protein component [Gallionellaceae bacterium]|nr:ribonuclease P protein component [Gallionellaceae bacterium]